MQTTSDFEGLGVMVEGRCKKTIVLLDTIWMGLYQKPTLSIFEKLVLRGDLRACQARLSKTIVCETLEEIR